MKDDPYSTLGGLDQLLFKDNVAVPDVTKKPSEPIPKQTRTHEPTSAHSRERSPASANGSANGRSTERSSASTSAYPLGHSVEAAPVRSPAPANEPTRTRVSAPGGHRADTRIAGGRHSHDLFQDQVRWINRVKLDLEETYGRRVTGNEIVQLALDLFISDYETHGEGSALISTLVLGQPEERGGR